MILKAALVDLVKKYSLTVNAKTQVPLVVDPTEIFNVSQKR